MPRRRLITDISADTVYFGALTVLIVASLFFGISVETRRGQWSGTAEEGDLPSGTRVELVRVIDGDEVSVRATGVPQANAFVVRLLGVKAFDSNLNDPVLAAVGQSSFRRLEQRLKEAEVLVVEYETYVLDRSGRLIAYVAADKRDVGLDLLSEGTLLAYTKYPFSRSEAYIEAEGQAQRDKNGLWSLPEVVNRAEALHAKWKSEANP